MFSSKATYRQILSASMVLLTSFVYGCKVGFVQAATPMFLSANSPFPVTPEDISWIASVAYTGTLISVVLCYTLSKKVSKRTFIFGCTSTFMLTWLLILTTSSAMVIIVCFFFYGVAASMLVITGNVYFSEIASAKNREILGVMYHLATAIGTQVEFPLSVFHSYRLLAVFPLVVSVITLLSSAFMVESPCFLLAKGRREEAVRVFCWLNDKDDSENVDKDLDDMEKYVEEQEKEVSDIKTIFMPVNLKLVAVLVVVNSITSVSTVTILTSYGALMIQNLAFAVNGTFFMTVYTTVDVACKILSLYTIRKFQRRSLLINGLVIGGLLQVVCGLFFYLEATSANHNYLLAFAIAFTLIAQSMYVWLTFAPALQVLKPEILPHKLKDFYTSLLAFTSDWAAFAVVKSYFALNNALHVYFLLLVYSLFSFVPAWVAYRYIPNTKGKSLYEIRAKYTNS